MAKTTKKTVDARPKAAKKEASSKKKGTKKAAAKKTVAKKATGSKTTAKKTPAKKTTSKKAAGKKAAARRRPSKPITAQRRHELVAQAAYFRSESQGFLGDAAADWLAAEAEVDARLAKAGIKVRG